MSRILFFGDLASTGFGTVTLDLGARLLKLGEDVRFWSLNAVPDLPEPFASRTLSVLSLDTTTSEPQFVKQLLDGLSPHKMWNGEPWGDWKPEGAIILSDYTAARMFVGQHVEAFRSLPTFHYCPIEGRDLPPAWKEMWEVIHPVAMSNFGAEQIEKVVGYRPPMVYHGVDTEVFRPVSKKHPVVLKGKDGDILLTSKEDCRQLWMTYFGAPRLPKTWLVRTDRHMPRKRYDAMIRALTPVLYRQAGTLLILHCNPFDQGGYLPDTISKLPGVHELRYAEPVDGKPQATHYGLFGRDYPQIILTGTQGMDRSGLVTLYNAADLYLSTSSEGFGLTIAEAIACGTPAVGPDYSAVPEVIGPAGVTVAEGREYDNEYDHKWWEIDEAAYSAAAESLIIRERRLSELAAKGPEHIRRSFSWDKAAVQFRDLIQSALPVEAVA